MKFTTHHAVSQIEQARAGIAFHFAARIFQRLENNHALRLFHRPCDAALPVKNRRFAFFRFVEPLPAARQNFLYNRRQRSPFFLHLRRKNLHAESVHLLKRPHLPAESPAHRAVYILQVIRNLRNAPRGVQTRFGKSAPEELLRLVALLPFEHRSNQRAKPLARILDRFPSLERSEFRFLPRAVHHGVHVERQNFFFFLALHFLVKTLPRFFAQPSPPRHLFEERGHFVNLARLIVRHGFIDIFHHVKQHIEPDNIRGPKCRGLRLSDARRRAPV